MKPVFLSVAGVSALASPALAVDHSDPAAQCVTKACRRPCLLDPIARPR